MSSCRTHAVFPAGKTTQVDLGGTGRPVIGKLLPPKGFEGNVKWQFALMEVQIYIPNLPSPMQPPIPANILGDHAKQAAFMAQWEQTDDGKLYKMWAQAMQASHRARDNGPFYYVTVDRDGSFRIDDVQAGDYSLSVRFDNVNNNGPGRILNYRLNVPEMDGGRSDEKLDLGTIRLEK